MIARASGISMGVNINEKEGFPQLGSFNASRANWYLARCQWIHEVLQGLPCVLPIKEELEGMADELKRAIIHHLSGINNKRVKWGWKATQSMLLLPFLHQSFPKLKVIHVVRNGLDMVYSHNQNHLSWSGDYILDSEERKWPKPIQSMLFWSRTNLAAATYGEDSLGKNYLRIRFEDLCDTPSEQVDLISSFIHARHMSTINIMQITENIRTPLHCQSLAGQILETPSSLVVSAQTHYAGLATLPDEHATVYENNSRYSTFIQTLRERAKEPHWQQEVRETGEDIVQLVPPNETIILVDEGQWGFGPLVPGRRVVPFTEHEGQYWGPPLDDETAIREVERLRRSGATFMIFVSPAFSVARSLHRSTPASIVQLPLSP